MTGWQERILISIQHGAVIAFVVCFERVTGLETCLYMMQLSNLESPPAKPAALKVIKKMLGLLPESTACLDILLFYRI
jgi:hypothetical protein